MNHSEALYRAVGRNIREARERSGEKLSQGKLAARLGVSRASIVNIEAGRQHAPLHLLWQIAEALGTDLTLLIPRHEDLRSADVPIQLDEKTIQQIERAANGNLNTQRSLASVISKLRTTIDATTIAEETA